MKLIEKLEPKVYFKVSDGTAPNLTLGEMYEGLSIFYTKITKSGICIVVNDDKNNIVGVDVTFFENKTVDKIVIGD